MADVDINKFRASVVRDGSKPASPGFIVSEGQDPVNPPGTNNYVPYSGATANVELGEYGVEAGFITLDTTPTNIPTDQGAIYWDDTRSTAALIMNGTLQHIGQDSFLYVKNSSGSTIPKGTCVGFAGTDGGSGHLLVTPFLANGSVPSTYFMGVTAEAIANGSFGQVMHFGELEGINTSGFTAGALLYASSTVAGAFQTTAPVAPNNIILVAAAVNSKNNGAIVVRPTYGSNINTDEGVKITSPTTGDLLQLQAGGLWENKTLAQVIGSAYVPSTRTITINGTTQDLSADRTFNVGDMLLGDIQTVTARKDFNSNTLQLVVNGTSQKTILTNSPIDTGSYSLAINAFGFNASNNLYFSKGGNNNGIFAFSNSATRTYTLKDASGTLAFTSDIPSLSGYVQGSGTTNYLPKFTGSTTIGNSNLINDASGNLGLGVTPSAWVGATGLQVQYATVEGRSSIPSFAEYGANTFSDSGVRKYITSDFASRYTQFQSTHFWFTAPSGTAGNAISFTQAMTLTSGGNLLVGTTTDNGARLQVSGSGVAFNFTTSNGLIGNINSSAANGGYVTWQTSGTTIADIGTAQQVFGAGGSDTFGINARGSRSLILGTNNTARLTIASTGAATFSSSVTAAQFLASSSSNAAIITSTGTTGYGLVAVGSAGGARDIFLAGQSGFSNGFTVQYTGTEMRYGFQNGNVGIGTASPSTGLHLSGTGAFPVLRIQRTDSSSIMDLGFGLGNAASNMFTLIDRMAGVNRFNITSGGNVLIGTTTSGSSRLRIVGLPTSAAGLSSGDVWSDSGTLKIA